MKSVPLAEAVDRLWRVFGPPAGLLPKLPADAVMARASSGELKPCLPRLLELVAAEEIAPTHPHEVFALMHGWEDWPPAERNAVYAWADAWWLTALADHPGTQPAADVLGEIIHLQDSMVRWLDVWRDQLDGAGAKHLADAVLDAEETDAWAARPDQHGRLVAWAASEPILMGLALVGGVHLEDDRLGATLDRLLDA